MELPTDAMIHAGRCAIADVPPQEDYEQARACWVAMEAERIKRPHLGGLDCVTLPIEIGAQEVLVDLWIRYSPGARATRDDPGWPAEYEIEHAEVGGVEAPRWLVAAAQADINEGGPVYDRVCERVPAGPDPDEAYDRMRDDRAAANS